jgi:hypothetical protein
MRHPNKVDATYRLVKESSFNMVSKTIRCAKKVAAKTDSKVVEHRGNRHRRSEEARIAILEAADNLLVERGFTALTMEGIAAAAGVAKQTIYRWWRSKTEVLMDALLEDVAEGSFICLAWQRCWHFPIPAPSSAP